MNIKEKSQEYAKGKAMEAITAAIEKAYEDGYNDGLKHQENAIIEAKKDGLEYKDLMLTSGTMWASSYITCERGGTIEVLPYLEASKMAIPTKEQFKELCRECNITYYLSTKRHGIKFTGINGESIVIPYYSVDDLHNIDYQQSCIFWLKDDEDGIEKICADFNKIDIKGKLSIKKVFMGLKLPILLVK